MSETSTEQGPPLAASGPQAHPPGRPVTDVIAWIMVAAPLLAPFIDLALLRAFGTEPNSRLVPLAYLLFYLVLGLTDANRIEASGRNVRGIHLRTWAVLLPPVYFIQRARVLGHSFVMFFACLGVMAASVALHVFFFIGTWRVTELPRCNTSFSAERAKAVFDTIKNNYGFPLGVRALDVGNVVEKTVTDKTVSCEATIRGDDRKTYYVIIVHEWQGSDIYTKVGIYSVR
jgi:hypothetical protein